MTGAEFVELLRETGYDGVIRDGSYDERVPANETGYYHANSSRVSYTGYMMEEIVLEDASTPHK